MMNDIAKSRQGRWARLAKASLPCLILLASVPTANSADSEDFDLKEFACSFTKDLCDDALPGKKLNPTYALCQKLRDFCWSGNSANLDESELQELLLEIQRFAMELEKQPGRT